MALAAVLVDGPIRMFTTAADLYTCGEEPRGEMVKVCLEQPESECAACAVHGRLKCRFKPRHLAFFYLLCGFYFTPALIGVYRAGFGWSLLGWLGIGVVFFGFWEIRILCSHCPYYAEPGPLLRCIGNYGLPKFWRYHPEPISRSEKVQFIIGLLLVFGYPFPFLFLGGQLLFATLTAGGLVLFFAGLLIFTCPKCINFSCLLNRAPQEVVKEYLDRNPVMKKAFEE
jgi:hypothetical protein